MKLHRTYYRALKLAYDNLLDKTQFKSFEQFRKRLLIMCDYCKTYSFVEADKNKAIQLALFLKTIAEPYDVIRIEDDVVMLKRPLSQRIKPISASKNYDGMDEDMFKKSALDVLTKAAHLIGVSYQDLLDEATSSILVSSS